MLCILGCSQSDHLKTIGKTQEQDLSSATLNDLIYVDMFSPDYDTQHPLVCGVGRDFPNGKEMAFKQSESEESVHAVFPADVTPPKELDGKFVLHGCFQGIQNRGVYKLKKPTEDYRYFVVSSWEHKK